MYFYRNLIVVHYFISMRAVDFCLIRRKKTLLIFVAFLICMCRTQLRFAVGTGAVRFAKKIALHYFQRWI